MLNDYWFLAMCGLGLLSAMASIPRLTEVFPPVFAGLFRTRDVISFENTLRQSRERDVVVLLLLPAFLLCLAAYNVIPLKMTVDMPPSLRALWTLIVTAAYLAFRAFCSFFLGPREADDRILLATRRSFFSFAVLAECWVLLTYVLLLPFHLSPEVLRLVFQVEILLIYSLFLLRKSQILRSYNTFFKTFSYLCTLEVLPAAPLVVAVVLL